MLRRIKAVRIIRPGGFCKRKEKYVFRVIRFDFNRVMWYNNRYKSIQE